jgi:cbb3-type cytochrome oxidase maturation protein
MESLLFLIPVALIIVVIAIRTLFWAVKSGQYDDLDTEGQRILFDNERIDHPPETAEVSTDAKTAGTVRPDQTP